MAGPKSDSREQIIRLFSIMKILLNRRSAITANHIKDCLEKEYRIEVGLRTIQRDLAMLKQLDFEIESGEFRGYFLPRNEITSMIFTDSEVQALRLGRSLFDYFEGTEIKSQIDTAIELIVGKHGNAGLTASYLAELDSQFIVHLGSKHDLSKQNGITDDLFTAINGHTQIAITYHRPSMNHVPLIVEPYRIILYRDSLYLLGHRPKANHLQIFHLSRISSVELLSEEFCQDSELLETFENRLSYSMGIMVSGEITNVAIHFNPTVTDALQERVWHHSQLIEETESTTILRMTVLDSDELISWILSWGKMVQKIEPRVLAEKVRESRGM